MSSDRKLQIILEAPLEELLLRREQVIFRHISLQKNANKFLNEDSIKEFTDLFLKLNDSLPGEPKAKKKLSELKLGFLEGFFDDTSLQEKAKAYIDLWNRWQQWHSKDDLVKAIFSPESTDDESSAEQNADESEYNETYEPSYSRSSLRRFSSHSDQEESKLEETPYKEDSIDTLLPGVPDSQLSEKEKSYLQKLTHEQLFVCTSELKEKSDKFKSTIKMISFNYTNCNIIADFFPQLIQLCAETFREYAKNRRHKETADSVRQLLYGWDVSLISSASDNPDSDEKNRKWIANLIAADKVKNETLFIDKNENAYLVEHKLGKPTLARKHLYVSPELSSVWKKNWKILNNNLHENESRVERNAETIPLLEGLCNSMNPDASTPFNSFSDLNKKLSAEFLNFMKTNKYTTPPGVFPMLLYQVITNLQKLNNELHLRLDATFYKKYGAKSKISYGPSGVIIERKNEKIRLSPEDLQEKLHEVLEERSAARKRESERRDSYFESRSISDASKITFLGDPTSAGSSVSAGRSINDAAFEKTLRVPATRHGKKNS